MELAVIHTINNSSACMGVLTSFDRLPDGYELLSTATSSDVARAICIRRAPSQEAWETTLTELLGDSTRNDVWSGPVQRACQRPDGRRRTEPNIDRRPARLPPEPAERGREVAVTGILPPGRRATTCRTQVRPCPLESGPGTR